MSASNRFQYVIVGGGPAGLATALFLAAESPGITDRIVVLEKERYPREKPCAGAIGARADVRLSSIGVVVDVPSAPIDALAVRTRDATVVTRNPGAGRVVRRDEFDHELARVAEGRGITVRQGVRVLSVDMRADGVTVRTTAGELSAQAVIGADGVSGTMRRAFGFPETPHRAQALEVDTERVASDGPPGVILFDLSRRSLPGYYWDFPTVVNGKPLMCRGVYYLRSFGGAAPIEIEQVLGEELARRGLQLSRYRKRRYAERGYSVRSPIGTERGLLVGEAAGIDPVTGEGIAQAIEGGAVAGTYLARRLRAGDTDFSGFRGEVLRTRLGRDLAVRQALLALAYGKHRPAVEAFLRDTPELLEVGFAHFKGSRSPRRTVARLSLAAAAAVVSATRDALVRGGLSTGGKAGLP